MDSVQVTFLGSGDAFSSGGRLHTCILVKSERRQILVDCGASALVSLKKYHVNPNDIDMIFITHLHGDHFGGIPFFILDAQLINKRTGPLLIAGPPGTKSRIVEAMEVMFRGSTVIKQKFDLEIIEFNLTKTNEIDDVTVTAFEVNHPSGDPSLALRIEHMDKIITYTGDTDWTDSLITASKKADLLIAECYSYDKKIKYHLDYHTLSSHIHEMNPKKVILTHMSEEMLRRVDEIDCDYAEDGKSIYI
ncbi:MBL fold metallo-hydrolase [bacterium LRH843]|nr:MBL fold metallo-hydrolase [bacterium LRH843]